jgi:hypothetical protein
MRRRTLQSIDVIASESEAIQLLPSVTKQEKEKLDCFVANAPRNDVVRV